MLVSKSMVMQRYGNARGWRVEQSPFEGQVKALMWDAIDLIMPVEGFSLFLVLISSARHTYMLEVMSATSLVSLEAKVDHREEGACWAGQTDTRLQARSTPGQLATSAHTHARTEAHTHTPPAGDRKEEAVLARTR